jgi:hypothetical protein
MKCAKVSKDLPLLAGGDLGERKKLLVRAHLEACGECRALHEELLRSRAWRAATLAPRFEEAEAAELRQAVWREIRASGHGAGAPAGRGAGAAFWRAAGVAAALLIGFAAAIQIRPGRGASRVSPPDSIPPRATAVALATPPRLERPVAREPASETPPLSRARGGGRSARAVTPDLVRIEFQTANPDVRIIWLVKKDAESPSATPGRHQEVS